MSLPDGGFSRRGLQAMRVLARTILGPVYRSWSRAPRLRSVVLGLRKSGTTVYFRPFVLVDLFVLVGVLTGFTYEPYVKGTLDLKTGDTLVDAGAHIGYYALYGSKRVGKAGRVVAVEPHPKSFEILSRNVRVNSLDNVSVVNAALSSQTGKKILHDFDNEALGRDPAFSQVVDSPGGRAMGAEQPVRTFRLEELVQKLGIQKVDWIVLDVEGHELAALEGAEGILRRQKVRLIVETSSREAVSFLKGLGYTSRHLWDSPSGLFGIEYFCRA